MNWAVATSKWSAMTKNSDSVTVALTRRADTPEGLIHVVVMGSAIGLEIVATLPDDEKGRAVADFTGPAVLRAAELTETEFAARPEAC